jgi:hypothetical protein
MTRTTLILVLVATMFASAAAAKDTYDPYKVGEELGSVIGAESACGLTYDQGAIARFVAERVPATDMGFAHILSVNVTYVKRQFDQKSQSELTAYCTQTKRVAKQYGLIQ